MENHNFSLWKITTFNKSSINRGFSITMFDRRVSIYFGPSATGWISPLSNPFYRSRGTCCKAASKASLSTSHDSATLTLTLERPGKSRIRDAWPQGPTCDISCAVSTLLRAILGDASCPKLAKEFCHRSGLVGYEFCPSFATKFIPQRWIKLTSDPGRSFWSNCLTCPGSLNL